VLPPNIAALIIDPKIYAFPYVIMIMILAIVALTLFIKFPSLKNYRRRRSIIFYTVLFLAFMLLIFQAYDVGSRALVSYGVEFDVRFYPETTNQLNLTCSSDGGRYCSFYLVVRSVNASFPAQTQPNYVQVNSTVIRVHFTLSENWFSRSKTTESVLFNIDKNVTGFSFTLRLDSWSKGCLFISGQPFVSYVWNGTENCFVPYEDGIWVA
jgi:hypothetical protein